ncbi:hypothetical protein Tco_0814356 [Tanacetum coccineum]
MKKLALSMLKNRITTSFKLQLMKSLAHSTSKKEKRSLEADKARLLHMGSHTLQQLKKLSFDEVKELFETTMKRFKETKDRNRLRTKLQKSKDDQSLRQLQQLMIIVLEERMNVEALQTKYLTFDWKFYTKELKKVIGRSLE